MFSRILFFKEIFKMIYAKNLEQLVRQALILERAQISASNRTEFEAHFDTPNCVILNKLP